MMREKLQEGVRRRTLDLYLPVLFKEVVRGRIAACIYSESVEGEIDVYNSVRNSIAN